MESEKKDRPEDDLLMAKPAWKSFFVFYTAMVIFGIGPTVNPEAGVSQTLGVMLTIFSALFVIFRRNTTFYRITKEEILREIRFSGKVFTKSLPRKEVAGIAVRRGAVHRLLGIGHIQFQSRTGRTDLWWYGLDDPFTLKKRAEQILRS
jgi:hypothetical protein